MVAGFGCRALRLGFGVRFWVCGFGRLVGGASTGPVYLLSDSLRVPGLRGGGRHARGGLFRVSSLNPQPYTL